MRHCPTCACVQFSGLSTLDASSQDSSPLLLAVLHSNGWIHLLANWAHNLPFHGWAISYWEKRVGDFLLLATPIFFISVMWCSHCLSSTGITGDEPFHSFLTWTGRLKLHRSVCVYAAYIGINPCTPWPTSAFYKVFFVYISIFKSWQMQRNGRSLPWSLPSLCETCSDIILEDTKGGMKGQQDLTDPSMSQHPFPVNECVWAPVMATYKHQQLIVSWTSQQRPLPCRWLGSAGAASTFWLSTSS